MEKINIAKILKDCPKGTKLYSPLCGECELYDINDYGIRINPIDSDSCICLYDEGNYCKTGECLLFPSKENRDWSKFQRPFKNGDIIKTITHNEYVFYSIYKGIENEQVLTYIDYAPDDNRIINFNHILCRIPEILKQSFATEEEKQKLFDAIKANGYRWNAETKTLEKLINRNKFTVGAIITNGKIKGKICSRDIDSYKLEDGTYVFFNEVHNWELVPNKFDINTLKTFDKVLVRDKCGDVWTANFYSHYDTKSDKPFVCVGWSELNEYIYCIPYESNEYLLGTNDDCNECYKTWE